MNSRIEQQVMAGVGVVYALRQLTSRVALECYALAAAGIALWQLTWVHKVAANFLNVEHQGLGAMGTYLSYAVVHTHPATQISLVVAAAAGIALIVDATRTLVRPHPSLSPRL
jgi:hypothetical protein